MQKDLGNGGWLVRVGEDLGGENLKRKKVRVDGRLEYHVTLEGVHLLK